MKVSYLHAIAAILVLLPAGAAYADDLAETAPAATPAAAPANAPAGAAAATPAPTAQAAATDDWDPVRQLATSIGAWGVHSTGSPTKVGEYQSVNSSPFWDVDGLFSDGVRTLDITATGTDNDTDNLRLHYYGGPQFSANVDFERFDHQLDSNNYGPFLSENPATGQVTAANGTPIPKTSTTTATPANTTLFTRSDLDPGKDYAISVDEFKADFKGDLADGLKWRVNVFGIYKEGERQANAFTHCYGDTYYPAATPTTTSSALANQCHVVSQSQHINWKTTEVEPMLEAHPMDGLTVQYSHLIRSFTQSDQVVTSNWDHTPAFGYGTGTPGSGTAAYDIVPDSTTQIDRLKVHAEFDPDNDAYAAANVGDTEDQLTGLNRHFGGADLRFTNRAIDGLTLTAYGKAYTENTETPTQSLNTLYPAMAALYQDPQATYAPGTQINRDETSVGTSARWRPFFDDRDTWQGGLAFTAAYEYSQIRRSDAGATLLSLYTNPANPSGPFIQGLEFVQPNSDTQTVSLGVEEKWSSHLSTYIRYKYIDTEYPLYGITPDEVQSVFANLDTSLPTLQNRVEIGGTWAPSDSFMLNATFYVENALNHGPYVDFDSTSYPFVVSMWLRPTDRWTFTMGYAEFTNLINQNVTLGALADVNPYATPAPAKINPSGYPSVSVPWQYNGKSDVISLGVTFKVTERMRLTSDFEYVRGLDSSVAIVNPSSATPPPAAPIPAAYNVGSYSLVSSDTYTVSAGVDYLWRPSITTYFRYNYYDFVDLSGGGTSGQMNAFLIGMTAKF